MTMLLIPRAMNVPKELEDQLCLVELEADDCWGDGVQV